MSSKTTKRLASGKMAPRATSMRDRSAIEPAGTEATPNSNDCCQWSLPPWLLPCKKSSNCCAMPWPNASRPGKSAMREPKSCAASCCKMRAAPGFTERTTPAALSTRTPDVKLSKMVCKRARAASSWTMLVCTVCLASANCCVMDANARVNPPSSSLLCKANLGVKSPAATWLTPSVSTSKGRAI